MGPIVALVLSLLIATGGSGAVAYAAQDAMPNDPLYAVKIFSEDARVNLTSDETARANLLLDLTLRRVDEIAATNGTNAQVIEREQTQIASALQIAAQLNDSTMSQVLTRAHDVLNQGLQTMDANPALAQARNALADQNTLVQSGLDNPVAFRSRFQNDAGHTSPFPIGVPPPPFTATVPITGTWTPPFTATIPITGTWARPPFPPGTPPFTATVPVTGTLPPPPPPFTATVPLTGTLPPPPPPFTATVPLTGTLPPPPPPFTATVPLTGTLPPPPPPVTATIPITGTWATPPATPVPHSTPPATPAPYATPPHPQPSPHPSTQPPPIALPSPPPTPQSQNR